MLAVITHLNAPKLAEPPNDQKHVGIRIEEREPLADDKISYGGMNSLEADGKFDFKESNKLGFQSFGAQFCEVKIDLEGYLRHPERGLSRRRGEKFALATLVRAQGSSYRRPGACMLICEDGKTVGSLSAGCLEQEVASRALGSFVKTGESAIIEF